MVVSEVSAARRREVIGALRRGTVPHAGLDLFAVGLERFENALDEELSAVASKGAVFKAVRGSTDPARRSSPDGSPNAPNGADSPSARSRCRRPRPPASAGDGVPAARGTARDVLTPP